MNIRIYVVGLFSCLLCGVAQAGAAGKKKGEAFYQKAWVDANGGKMEVRMGDGTRCDIVTDTHAIEVEWDHKWAEGIGQSLWYSFQTNKKAGIVLILKNGKDRKHLMRLRSLIENKKLDIRVWTVTVEP